MKHTWLPIIGKSFTGNMASAKKQAERSAATKALQFLQAHFNV
jgi:hypothetical protein